MKINKPKALELLLFDNSSDVLDLVKGVFTPKELNIINIFHILINLQREFQLLSLEISDYAYESFKKLETISLKKDLKKIGIIKVDGKKYLRSNREAILVMISNKSGERNKLRNIKKEMILLLIDVLGTHNASADAKRETKEIIEELMDDGIVSPSDLKNLLKLYLGVQVSLKKILGKS